MSTPQHPKTFKAWAYLKSGGGLTQIDLEWKDPQPGEIVVKVLACGICGRYDYDVASSVGLYMTNMDSDELVRVQPQYFHPVQYPRVPGHEIIGDVVAIPSTENFWKIGQRVGSGYHGGHCSTCGRCRTGDFTMCTTEQVNAIHRDGGYAEYVTLRTEAVCSVPADIDPAEAAPLMCAGVTAFNSIRHMNASPPDVVAIQGIGGTGHLALQIARSMGFCTVALSSSSGKKELAEELGAQYYFDGSKVNQAEELQKLGGAKLIMCTAPNSLIIQSLIGGLDVDGELLLIAMTDTATVPVVPMIGRRFNLRGWMTGSAKDMEDTVRFAQLNNIKSLVERFPLDKAPEAVKALSTAKFRPVIIP